ncbi:MAG: leucine-rich repeat domain-containing protein [Bacilli bacterium]|jgi:hypothetical protein
MKKTSALLAIICFFGCLSGCRQKPALSSDNSSGGDGHSSSSLSESSESPLEEIVRNSPENVVDDHLYQAPEFRSFPTFLASEWNLNLKFTLSDDGTYYIVSDELGADRRLAQPTLIIPPIYQGKPVKEIAQAAEGVGAFSELTWLKDVYLPASITKIAHGTFSLSNIENLYYDCENLEDFQGRNWVFYPPFDPNYIGMNVYFGPHVQRLPNRLFYPNVNEPNFIPKINHVYFDENCPVTAIGDHAFHNVEGFTTLSLPDTVEEIGLFAFYRTSFSELTLPANLRTIGEDAFGFAAIKHLRVNENLAFIGERAFAYSRLCGLDLSPSKLTVISDETFAHAQSLAWVQFPETLREIGVRAFYHNALVDLIIPDQVTAVNAAAFAGAQALKRLYLGRALTTLQPRAFFGCANLLSLEIASVNLQPFSCGNDVFTQAGKSDDLLVYVLDGVNSLPSYLFFGTADFEQLPRINVLTLPHSLATVGTGAFAHLTLTRVNYRGSETDYHSIIFEDGFTFSEVDFGGGLDA